jgi:transposase
MSDPPPVSRLTGQLRYLFEDEPALRHASSESLAARLNHDDRFSRARARYPLETDDEVRAHIDEFDERIRASDVETALAQLTAADERARDTED